MKVLPKRNIYVANDKSTDKTAKIVKSLGVHIINFSKNIGKARAIVRTFRRFKLLKRYKAVIIHDADVEIDRKYLKYALPLLKDPGVACVAGYQEPRSRKVNFIERFFILYRTRLWLIVQYGMRFGQTWSYTNVSYIIPGSLSIYKSSVLKQLDIDAPGLIIEDFNMTFEVHKKRLGRIAYTPLVRGYHQDPYTLSDYIKQVKRWDIGFWQTVKKNGIWPSLFWLSTGSFIIELLSYSFLIVSIPLLLFLLMYPPYHLTTPFYTISALSLFTGFLVADYLLTTIAAVVYGKSELFFYGLGFFFLRYIDAFLFIFTLPIAFLSKYQGTWESPKRKYSGSVRKYQILHNK